MTSYSVFIQNNMRIKKRPVFFLFIDFTLRSFFNPTMKEKSVMKSLKNFTSYIIYENYTMKTAPYKGNKSVILKFALSLNF